MPAIQRKVLRRFTADVPPRENATDIHVMSVAFSRGGACTISLWLIG